MAIISIARELGAHGDEIGELLARRLPGTLLNKELLEKRFKEFGVNLKTLQRYDERRPGFWASFSAEQDVYLHILKTVVYEEMNKGACVILGRGGNILLQDLANCLRIRLVAPFEVRVQRLMEQLSCTKKKAEKTLETSDKDRTGFCRFHFNSEWAAPTEYQLVLNTACFSAEQCVEMLLSCSRQLIGPEQEAAGHQQLQDRILAQNIIESIIFQKNIPVQFLEVQCSNGTATLFGVVSSPNIARAAEEATQAVSGVKAVDNRIQVVREQPLRRM
ncbi:MAG: BON domain-containing protein [Oligosphaeraceae bacterium]|nr:BON domain-containing protein [Oligosphaeraceae bacterium]